MKSTPRSLPIHLFIAAFALLLVGCGGKKTGAGDANGANTTDFTALSNLPARGNFNPDTDVDYSQLNSGDMANAGIIYFGSDSSTIPPAERAKLERIAKWMQENPTKQILVAGHCDDRGTLEYNRALGERRSIAVRDYLIGLSAAPGKIYTHSYGEEKPATTGSGDSAWAKNRRAEIGVIVK